MADKKQLRILKQGAEKWNEWRNANPEIVPDFSNTDLAATDLSNRNLSGCNLSRSLLNGVYLENTNLRKAVIFQTDLRKAELEKVDLSEAILINTDISKANLRNARVIADELRSFVTDFAIPVIPLFQPSEKEPKPYASLHTLYKKYHWVLEPIEYQSENQLMDILLDQVVKPAEAKRQELYKTKQLPK